MGVPLYIWGMFVRKKKNKSGTVSVQIIDKSRGKYKVIKTIGCDKTRREEDLMILLANTKLKRISGHQTLFVDHDDLVVENFVNSTANNHLQIIGTELILGKIYSKIGFVKDGCPIAQNRKRHQIGTYTSFSK